MCIYVCLSIMLGWGGVCLSINFMHMMNIYSIIWERIPKKKNACQLLIRYLGICSNSSSRGSSSGG